MLVLTVFQAKKQYEKAFRESEKAQEAYKKADADIHMSRADVEKVSEQSDTMICWELCVNICKLKYYIYIAPLQGGIL